MLALIFAESLVSCSVNLNYTKRHSCDTTLEIAALIRQKLPPDLLPLANTVFTEGLSRYGQETTVGHETTVGQETTVLYLQRELTGLLFNELQGFFMGHLHKEPITNGHKDP